MEISKSITPNLTQVRKRPLSKSPFSSEAQEPSVAHVREGTASRVETQNIVKGPKNLMQRMMHRLWNMCKVGWPNVWYSSVQLAEPGKNPISKVSKTIKEVKKEDIEIDKKNPKEKTSLEVPSTATKPSMLRKLCFGFTHKALMAVGIVTVGAGIAFAITASATSLCLVLIAVGAVMTAVGYRNLAKLYREAVIQEVHAIQQGIVSAKEDHTKVRKKLDKLDEIFSLQENVLTDAMHELNTIKTKLSKRIPGLIEQKAVKEYQEKVKHLDQEIDKNKKELIQNKLKIVFLEKQIKSCDETIQSTILKARNQEKGLQGEEVEKMLNLEKECEEYKEFLENFRNKEKEIKESVEKLEIKKEKALPKALAKLEEEKKGIENVRSIVKEKTEHLRFENERLLKEINAKLKNQNKFFDKNQNLISDLYSKENFSKEHIEKLLNQFSQEMKAAGNDNKETIELFIQLQDNIKIIVEEFEKMEDLIVVVAGGIEKLSGDLSEAFLLARQGSETTQGAKKDLEHADHTLDEMQQHAENVETYIQGADTPLGGFTKTVVAALVSGGLVVTGFGLFAAVAAGALAPHAPSIAKNTLGLDLAKFAGFGQETEVDGTPTVSLPDMGASAIFNKEFDNL